MKAARPEEWGMTLAERILVAFPWEKYGSHPQVINVFSCEVGGQLLWHIWLFHISKVGLVNETCATIHPGEHDVAKELTKLVRKQLGGYGREVGEEIRKIRDDVVLRKWEG